MVKATKLGRWTKLKIKLIPQKRWALRQETAIFKGLKSSKYTHPVETLWLVDLYWTQM